MLSRIVGKEIESGIVILFFLCVERKKNPFGEYIKVLVNILRIYFVKMDTNRMLKTIVETNSRMAKTNQHISEFLMNRESRAANRVRFATANVLRINPGVAQSRRNNSANARATH